MDTKVFDNSSAPRGAVSKDEQIREIVKCGKDPIYFIDKYVKIQHPSKGLVPCRLYNFQKDVVSDLEKYRCNIVVKARQLGLSTITAAYALWFALFRKDKNILVIATKLSTAIGFIKKVKVALENLPPWLLLTSYTTTFNSVKFGNRSVVTAIPTAEDSGRGESLSLLIVDECALIRNFDTLWASLSPTVSVGGNVILISTPYGVGGQYYKMWVDAEAGLNGFNPIKLTWDVHPEHDQLWYENECKRLNFSKKKIAQELCCSFAASGDTFLQQEDFDYLSTLVNENAVVDKMGADRGTWIWRHPQPDRRYVVSADISRGDASDFSACHVVDVDSLEVVAEYKGKSPPDAMAGILADIGRRYNNALVCPENNTFGYTTCVRLRDSGYPNLYYPSMKGSILTSGYRPSDTDEIPGFTTATKTRVQMLSRLEELIRTRRMRVYSPRFYEEAKSFVWNGNKAQALRGCNDDLVMSLAIACWLLDDGCAGDADATASAQALLSAMSVTKREEGDKAMGYINQPIVGDTYTIQTGMRASAGLRPGTSLVSPMLDLRWLMR